MTIAKQLRLLILANSLLLLFALALAGYHLAGLGSVFTDYQRGQAVINRLIELKAAALTISRVDLMLPDTPRKIVDADVAIQRAWSDIASALDSEERKRSAATVIGNWDNWYKFYGSALRITTTTPADALSIPDQIYGLYLVPMSAELDRLTADRQALGLAQKAQIEAAIGRLLWVVLLPLLAAGATIVVVLGRFARRLGRRFGDMAQVAALLRDGELSQRLPTPNHDEISQLADAINEFLVGMEVVMKDIDDAAVRLRETATTQRARPAQLHALGDLGGTSERIRRAIAQGRTRRQASAAVVSPVA